MKMANNKTGKRPYVKPQIEKIQLSVGEAVFQACKSVGSPGKNEASGCRTGTSSCKFVHTGS
jgi:hypothetical protein